MTRERDRCTSEFPHDGSIPEQIGVRCQLPKKHSGGHKHDDPKNDRSWGWRNDPTIEDRAEAAWAEYKAEFLATPARTRTQMRKREFIAGFLAALRIASIVCYCPDGGPRGHRLGAPECMYEKA